MCQNRYRAETQHPHKTHINGTGHRCNICWTVGGDLTWVKADPIPLPPPFLPRLPLVLHPGMLRPPGPCGLEAKSFGLSLGLTLSGLGLDLSLMASGLILIEIGLVASNIYSGHDIN